MNKYVWFNHYLPQTLQIAVAIAYFRAVFSILFSFGRLNLIELVVTALTVAGAFGIANLKFWGYWLSLASALLPFIFIFITNQFSIVATFRHLIGPAIVYTVIQVAIVALIVHPMSRDFVKTNFTK